MVKSPVVVKAIASLSFFLMTFLTAFSHEITLKNGGKVRGAVIKSDDQAYKIRTRGTFITLKTSDILSVDTTVHDEFETFYGQYADTEKNVPNLAKLAKTAREKGYSSFHLELCREILAIDPFNAMAREATKISDPNISNPPAVRAISHKPATQPIKSKVDTLLKSARNTKAAIQKRGLASKRDDPASELKKLISKKSYSYMNYYGYGSPYHDARLEEQRSEYFNRLYQSYRNNRFYNSGGYNYGYGGYGGYNLGYGSRNRFTFTKVGKSSYLRIGF